MAGIIALVVVGGIVLIGLVWLVAAYNGLVQLRNRAKNAWAQIDVQLKRRYDLIPNLVETAKGYMKHERELLENVTKARSACMQASGPAEQGKAENFLSQTLKSLFAVVENYPDLKANQTMNNLMEELTATENKISFARQHYNDSVMRLNTKTEVFPSNIVAGMFGFQQMELFEVADEEQREAVKVQF